MKVGGKRVCWRGERGSLGGKWDGAEGGLRSSGAEWWEREEDEDEPVYHWWYEQAEI